MKRLAIILCLLTMFAAMHARTAADFFIGAPGEAVPFLDRNARLDMLDYYRSKLPPKTTNAAGTQVRIDSESDRLLCFTAGDSIAMQLGVAVDGRDTLLVVIETLPIEVADSRVTVYDKSWRPHARQAVVQPLLADWLTKEGSAHRSEVEEWLPFMTATATYDPATQSLTFERTIDGYFSAKDSDSRQMLGYLKPQLSYTLKSGRFR